MDNKKPQLHQSHLQVLYRCGEKFRRIFIEGEREPVTTPLIVGTSTHSSIAFNLQNKIDKGHLLPKEILQDYARDNFIKTWSESPLILNEEEMSEGLKTTRDKMQDQTISLATEHHYSIAPKLRPVAVERAWVLEAKDKDGNDTLPFDLAGQIDVDEKKVVIPYGKSDPVEMHGIRDTKTRKTNLGQQEVDKSEQYTMYAMAKYRLDGKLPDYVAQDNLIKPTKNLPARAVTYYSKRNLDDFIVLFKRLSIAAKVIESGVYTPANPSDWWCSKDFCGFAANGTCPYFNSKTRETVNPIIEKENRTNGDTTKNKSIIESLKSTLDNERVAEPTGTIKNNIA